MSEELILFVQLRCEAVMEFYVYYVHCCTYLILSCALASFIHTVVAGGI